MDVNFELGDLKFVWDSEKAEINRKKHGVKFSVAARVFLDENRIDDFDEFHSNFEDRFKIIGRVKEIFILNEATKIELFLHDKQIKTRRLCTMNKFIIEKNIPPLTDEEIAELDALKKRKIDYSDIPLLTDEEIARFKANIRRKKNLKVAV